MEEKTILESKKVAKYLERIKSHGTMKLYRRAITDYFLSIDQHPDTYIQDPRKLRITDPIQEIEYIDKVKDDFYIFYKYMEKQGLAPLTKKNRISHIKRFLTVNNISLPESFWLGWRGEHGKANIVIDDISPTTQQVKALLDHGDNREKAIICCQSSSGMRIGELIDLKFKDVHFDDYEKYGVCLVEVRADNRGNKTHTPRITFFSGEALQYLQLYLEKERNRHQRISVKKGKNLGIDKKIEGAGPNDAIFPFSAKKWTTNSWRKLLRLAELDQRDDVGRFRYRSHSLRKYFKKMASRYNVTLCDQLIGHGAFSRRYSDITDKTELCKELKNLESYVTIGAYIDTDTTEEIKRLKGEMANLEKEMALVHVYLQGLTNNNKLEELEKRIERQNEK